MPASDGKQIIPLLIDVSAAGRMAAHLVRAYPHEGCGVLVGFDAAGARRVVDAIPVDNAWPDESEKPRRFVLDSREQLRIERSLDGTGKSLVGFYHSHPDHPAEPSAFDLEAAWGFYSYLIARVSRSTGVEEMRSWLLDERANAFVEQRVEKKI